MCLVYSTGGFFHKYSCRPEILFHIESYVAKYCSKSLRQFLLTQPPTFLFTEIQTSFINVETIKFHNYPRLCEVPFNTIFPNLKSIDLLIVWKGFNLICIPSVKNLFMYAIKTHQSINAQSTNEENEIKDLLKLNPQIEKLELKLTSGFSYDIIFHGLNENLPTLQRFILQMYSNNSVQRYHLDNVVDFQMIAGSKLTYIPFTFSKLERFKCRCFYNDTIASCVFDFIAENKQLKSIILRGVKDGLDGLSQHVSLLKNIEELDIEIIKPFFPKITSDFILNLFSQNQSLKKLTLIAYPENYESLNDLVKSKISKQEKNYSFQRFVKLTLHP